ncbi:MAG: flagellar motor stator protein MotA [Betaproteobacteria bacterium]|nr:flagellar motor stator protein MotA [Betaproteobacteria bacterium]
MFAIIGYIIVTTAVVGGFLFAGGHLGSLVQPAEYVMIIGSAGGAFFVANPPKILKSTLKALPKAFKGSKYTKALFVDLLSLLFEILAKVRKEGLMSIEADVEQPAQSPLFTKYPGISSDHHVVEFITDYLRMMVGGNLNAFEIENLMDNEIDTHHHEASMPATALARMADGLPAFGIVAAVMGVVHTMESVGIPPAELGKLIAAALVGTFLGILVSYGFVSPLSTLVENKNDEELKIYQCIKVVLLASMSGYAPQVAVEFGRKVLFSTERPSFRELEDEIKTRRKK